jgi:hypothetical protein
VGVSGIFGGETLSKDELGAFRLYKSGGR